MLPRGGILLRRLVERFGVSSPGSASENWLLFMMPDSILEVAIGLVSVYCRFDLAKTSDLLNASDPMLLPGDEI